jgi:hypothetical protein
MNAELEKWIDENGLQFVDTMGGFAVKLAPSKSCQYPCAEYVSVDALAELFAGKVLVPVELLHAIEIDLSMECTNFDTLNKLRAIIEDKP